jgi:hypothetical protein
VARNTCRVALLGSESTGAERRTSIGRAVGVGLLILVTLFHLQFALQALNNLVLQGVLALVATGALGAASYRMAKGRPAAALVFLGTLPLLIFHVLAVLLVEDESPVFILGSGITPLVAGVVWVVRRARSETPTTPSAPVVARVGQAAEDAE